MVDKLKFALAALLVVAGLAGFYYLDAQPTVVRVLVVIAGVVAGAALSYFTEPGRQFFAFARDAWDEAKKVVWPTRKETVQMTGVVFAFVAVMAAFLWLADKGFEAVIYSLILGWK